MPLEQTSTLPINIKREKRESLNIPEKYWDSPPSGSEDAESHTNAGWKSEDERCRLKSNDSMELYGHSPDHGERVNDFRTAHRRASQLDGEAAEEFLTSNSETVVTGRRRRLEPTVPEPEIVRKKPPKPQIPASFSRRRKSFANVFNKQNAESSSSGAEADNESNDLSVLKFSPQVPHANPSGPFMAVRKPRRSSTSPLLGYGKREEGDKKSKHAKNQVPNSKGKSTTEAGRDESVERGRRRG